MSKSLTCDISNLKSIPPYYHMVGIAGVGMSALAQVLIAKGSRVSGSDRHLDAGRNLSVLDKLREQGVEFMPQDGSGVKPGLSAVVVSTAIEPDNPDMLSAGRLGIPVIHRAELLAGVAQGKTLIGVTGTSGKTTVTGMIGWVLEQLGKDPTVVNGGNVLNWVNAHDVGNVRIGRSDTWVVELDESDESLLHFNPDWAVITNISKDHFDVSDVERLFKVFSRQVKCGIIGCFGADAENSVLADFNPELTDHGCMFEYQGVNFHVPLPGRHNAENALQSVMLLKQLGFNILQVSETLKTFKGIRRRLERVGEVHGVSVFDDYAHNPAKIRATWRAVQPFYKRVIGVWRPHGFGPLSMMMNELISTFADITRASDMLYVLPVYFAGGTADRRVTSSRFVEKLKEKGVPTEFVSGYQDLLPRMLHKVRSGDVVLFMGARDHDIPVFARRFLFELDDFLMNSMA